MLVGLRLANFEYSLTSHNLDGFARAGLHLLQPSMETTFLNTRYPQGFVYSVYAL
jgi:hypothetical protein